MFVGRPESNSALAAIAGKIGLDYNGAIFRAGETEHGSEYEALVYAGANPEDPRRMVLVLAGNSPLQTVKVVSNMANSQYAVYRNGKEIASGTGAP